MSAFSLRQRGLGVIHRKPKTSKANSILVCGLAIGYAGSAAQGQRVGSEPRGGAGDTLIGTIELEVKNWRSLGYKIGVMSR